MMMLLECPRLARSPSQNQTPGTMSLISPGSAAVRVAKNAIATRMAKPDNVSQRSFFKSKLLTASRQYTPNHAEGESCLPEKTSPLPDQAGVARQFQCLDGRSAGAGGVPVGHHVD